MNKTDLFMEKIRKSPISTHFPEFKGDRLCIPFTLCVGVDKLEWGRLAYNHVQFDL